eukprot:366154-Chlamydomonas_euryale.AAC.4
MHASCARCGQAAWQLHVHRAVPTCRRPRTWGCAFRSAAAVASHFRRIALKRQRFPLFPSSCNASPRRGTHPPPRSPACSRQTEFNRSVLLSPFPPPYLSCRPTGPRPDFKNVATVVLVFAATYATCYFVFGQPFAVPNGNVFAVVLVWALGHVGGFIAVQVRRQE